MAFSLSSQIGFRSGTTPFGLRLKEARFLVHFDLKIKL